MLILVLLALGAGLYLTVDRGWWSASQSLTVQNAAAGEQWRTLSRNGTTLTAVVVGHRDRWCQNPGLHVSTQVGTQDVDSVFSIAQALFEQFRAEAESSPGRYLAIHLEVGTGLHWPWTEPPNYMFVWDHTRTGWKCCSYFVPDGATPPTADRMKRAA
jgi:hypothetical protein